MKLSGIRFDNRKNRSELPEEEKAETKPAEKPTVVVKKEVPELKRRVYALPTDDAKLPSWITIARIAVAVVLILVSVIVKSFPDLVTIALRAVAALCAGFDIIIKTAEYARRKAFSYDGLPMLLAVILAFINGMSLEGAIAMTMLQIVLCLRNYAYWKTKDEFLRSIALPKMSSELALGDSFMLESGQICPAGCAIVQGAISVDLGSFKGERDEKSLKAKDRIPAGSQCLSGSALVEVIELPEGSVTAVIAGVIADRFEEVSENERKISSIANIVFPAFLAVGILMIILLPLLTELTYSETLRRIITIIAVGSPCGVLLTIPLIYLASMTHQRRLGTAFLSAPAVDKTSGIKTVVFDKLGTISTDSFEVREINSSKMDTYTMLKVSAHAVYKSLNPMANARAAAYGAPVSADLISDYTEYPGWGTSCTVGGVQILLGTGTIMEKNRIPVPRNEGDDCVLFLAVGGILAGRITLQDSVNPTVKDTLVQLYKSGVDRIAMLSGDSRERDGIVAKEIGINEYYAECSGSEKAKYIREIRERTERKAGVAYVCSPLGSREASSNADVSIVVNSTDKNALSGNADILVLGSALNAVPEALAAAKKAKLFTLGSVAVGLFFKLLIVALAAVGLLPLWFGFLIDSCISLGLIIACFTIAKSKE